MDIAEKIGVSTATISRVINKEQNVSPETKQKVEEALKSFNYQCRLRKKSSASKNQDRVFIIAGQINNPITVEYLDGLTERLHRFKKQALIAFSDYQEDIEIENLEYAKANGFSGIFLVNAIECPRLIELISSTNAPVILINRYLRSMDCNLVMIDNFRCGYMATQFLIDHGHKRIGHLAGPLTSITCQDRERGFSEAMRYNNLSIEQSLIFNTDRNYYESGKKYGLIIGKMPSDKRCTAVFAATALMASGMIESLNTCGLKVPGDISVICSDDSENVLHQHTGITTVGRNPYMMGQAAAELFEERLKEPNSPQRRIVFAPQIIERQSVKQLETEAN